MLRRSSHRCRIALRGWLLLASLTGVAAATTAGAAICRVDTLGGGDGSAWGVTSTLQGALTNSNCTELWVKSGTYTPTSGTDRGATFNIRSGVSLFGGFAGTESVRSARNPATNLTTLSGEIGAAGNADNSYTVVSMIGISSLGNITASTVLDGFTISGGNGIDPATFNRSGGGLVCDGHGRDNACRPTISNVIFSGNYADGGGAMSNNGSNSGDGSPTLINVTFSNNHSDAANGGGAILNYGYNGNSNPTLHNVTFVNNGSNRGGAIYNAGSDNGSSSPTLVNVTFSGNSASVSGGAMYTVGGTPTLSNVIAWGDSAASGLEIASISAFTTISYSVIQGSGGSGGGWKSSTGIDGGGNRDADPMLGTLASNGGATPSLLPGAGSSAIDNGNNASCTGIDQRGVLRPQGPRCDIGAVEVINPDNIFADGLELR
ncbi:hypothetical protein ELE36_00235 [Pseudolysobacter antarcticus]|uniref:Right-handed parallel beta-helix repeat-containing protein n=1 Tax=Pseudolysobacter antarcticus TaxID=2511995 RepID=A0A411HEL3_9GAMM|nr:choice-of-anchor Q domain-containing protein [Pseudolysobacter antarcticus]QBB68930.1 hypothetical protein ELE36_00235 [Pseudolysobacter antarcticus]